MEFIPEQEIQALLRELGINSQEEGKSCILLEMDSAHAEECHCLCNCAESCETEEGWSCNTMDSDALICAVVSTIHKIHEGQTILIPSGKWRSVFDVVAFSMAEDELWQEFDASATIKLNTRDPLLFESGDEHTLAGLLTAMMRDGETPDQSVYLLPAGAPLLMHIHPNGPVKLWFGNSALADEISETYAR